VSGFWRLSESITRHCGQRLETERVSSEQAERERDELRKCLESLQEMRGALQTGAQPVEGKPLHHNRPGGAGDANLAAHYTRAALLVVEMVRV
jgi:hypothetical protein